MKQLIISSILTLSLSFTAHYKLCFCQSISINNSIEKIVEFEKKSNNLKHKINKSKKNITGFDLKYHRFNWLINTDTLYIKGSILSVYEIISDSINNISFDLSPDLFIDSVKHNELLLPFVIDPSLENIKISLPRFYYKNEIDSLTIFYQGSPTNRGGISSFNKTFHKDSAIIWTLSQPYGSKDWWPCKNGLSDKIDSIDIFISTTPNNTAVSLGVLISDKTFNNTRTFHWKHRYPVMPYLIAIAVTNYEKHIDYIHFANDSMPMITYSFPEDRIESIKKTQEIIPAFDLYNEILTEYPFKKEKYGHAQFGWGGGMEHQTISFMGSWNYEVMVHELAHQWFGDYITCSNWKDIWLNEGFATYFTGIMYEHCLDGYYWSKWKNRVNNIVISEPDGSVIVDDTTSIGRIFNGRLSYNKGALVLHTLRWKIGDILFYKAINNYLNDTSLAYGTASTENFISHVSNVTSVDLTEFFQDWLYKEGYPVYTFNCEQHSQNSATITISQIPSHNSVDFFELPVPLKFSGDFDDTIIRLDNTFSGETFSIKTNFSFHSIEFDPEKWLIAKADTIYHNGIKKTSKNSSLISIYNPKNNTLFIEKNGLKNIRLIDIKGRVIFSKETHNKNSHLINCHKLSKGTYIIEIKHTKGIATEKIFIH